MHAFTKQAPAEWPLRNLKGKTVLLVDPNKTAIKTVDGAIRILEPDSLVVSGSAADAIQRCRSRVFDLIMCEHHLSETRTGHDLLEQIRSERLIPYETIFFMITSESSQKKVMATVELNPDDYILKPFAPGMLLERIDVALQQRKTLTRVYKALGEEDWHLAIKEAEDYLKNPDVPPKYRQYLSRIQADLSVRTGQFLKSRQLYQEAFDRDKVPWAQYGLGNVHHQLGEYEQASQILSHLVEESPNYVGAYDLLSDTFHRMGNDDEAIRVLRDRIDKSPFKIDARKRFAEILLATEQYDDAIEAYSHIVNYGHGSIFHDPSDHANLAMIQAEKGDWKKAIETLESSVRRFKNTPHADTAKLTTAIAKAKVYSKVWDNAAAEKAFKEAKELFEIEGGNIPANIRDVFAFQCIEAGESELGRSLLEQTLNNPLRQDLVEKRLKKLSSHRTEDVLKEITSDVHKKKVVLAQKLHSLVKEGNWDSALDAARQNGREFSHDIGILLSCVFVMYRYMDKHGKNPGLVTEAGKLYIQAQSLDPDKKHARFSAVDTIIKHSNGALKTAA